MSGRTRWVGAIFFPLHKRSVRPPSWSKKQLNSTWIWGFFLIFVSTMLFYQSHAVMAPTKRSLHSPLDRIVRFPLNFRMPTTLHFLSGEGNRIMAWIYTSNSSWLTMKGVILLPNKKTSGSARERHTKRKKSPLWHEVTVSFVKVTTPNSVLIHYVSHPW